ncbi:HNH endonuclease, partial [Tardiphaga sp.]|uniref:HNH endonuclease n=1 Tax=Tardiphaga sp. TaxID=1926292 RepID=UPI0037DA166F
QRFDHLIQPEPNTGCWLWLAAATTGRKSVGVGYGVFNSGRKNGRSVSVYAHRAAYEAIHGQGTTHGLVVRHSCDMPLCVNPAHLSTGTIKDNADDMVRRGRSLRGARSPHTRLSEAQVAEIRGLAGRVRQRDIGRRFGLTQSAVSRLTRGNRWRHSAAHPIPHFAPVRIKAS